MATLRNTELQTRKELERNKNLPMRKLSPRVGNDLPQVKQRDRGLDLSLPLYGLWLLLGKVPCYGWRCFWDLEVTELGQAKERTRFISNSSQVWSVCSINNSQIMQNNLSGLYEVLLLLFICSPAGKLVNRYGFPFIPLPISPTAYWEF